jgi:hypothetical protein
MANQKIGIEISAKDKTKAAFNEVNAGLSEMQSKLGVVATAVLGLAGAGTLGALVTTQAQAATEAVRYADALDMSSQEMMAWQSAAKSAGIEGGKMADILKDVSEKIGDAAIGGGEAVEVLERMNLSAKDMATLSPDKQLLQIAEGLGQIGSNSEKVQIMEALGSDLSLLLPLLDDNAKKFHELRQEAILFGEAVSEVDAQKIQIASEEIDRAGRVVAGVGRQIAITLAPYVGALADEFADAAKASGGFSDELQAGMQKVANAVGVVADAYRYLEIAFDTLALGGTEAVRLIVEGLIKLDEGVQNTLKNMTGLGYVMEVMGWLNEDAKESMEKLLGLDYSPSADLQIWADAAKQAVDDAAESLRLLLSEDMPSKGVEEAFDRIREKADEIASRAAEEAGGQDGGQPMAVGAFVASGDDEAAQAAQDRYVSRLHQRIETLNQSLMTERELEALRYEEKELLIEEAFQQGLIKQSERNTMREALEAQHQDRMNQIAYKGLAMHEKFATAFRKGDIHNMLQWGAQMTQGVAQQNRTMFNMNKGFSLAQAGLSLPSAVLQSFERGGGYPWGLVPAGLMLAEGLSQIQAISSARYSGSSGGGSTPSLSGSGVSGIVATVPATSELSDSASSGSSVNIQFTGNIYAMDDFKETVLGTIREAVDDQDQIIIGNNSRQASELGIA